MAIPAASRPSCSAASIPVGSYIIATEELPPDLAAGLIPKDKSVYDTRRVLTYYRMSGDRQRLIFGGRAKFGQYSLRQTAPILYRFMTDRFPQLDGWQDHPCLDRQRRLHTFDEVPHMGERTGSITPWAAMARASR